MIEYSPLPSRWLPKFKGDKVGYVYQCDECDNAPDTPMLQDELWLSIAGPKGKRALLCISCVVKKLGRPLTLADLNNSILTNSIIYFVAQMQEDK